MPYSPILLSQLPGNAFTPPDTCSFFQQPTGRDSDNTLLMLPGEGIVAAINKVGHWEFQTIKIINDVVMTLTGILIAWVMIGSIEGVR